MENLNNGHLFLEDKWKELKDSFEWKNRRERPNTSFSLKYDEQTIFIHNPDLFSMFEIEGTNYFLNDLRQGYNNGLESLKNNDEITLKDLRNSQTRELTIDHLKHILFNKNFKNNNKGLLSKVRFATPLIWSSKTLYFEGYCNGLFYSINEMLNKAGININELEKTSPEDDLIKRMIPKINADIFHFSTEQQWNDFKNGNFLDLKIEIKQTTQIQRAVAVIYEIAKLLNVKFTQKELEQYNVFIYKEKTLTHSQIRDANNNIGASQISHYFK